SRRRIEDYHNNIGSSGSSNVRADSLFFFATLVVRKLFKVNIKPYIPDFKLAFEHFCIHAGGRAVLDELEKNLQLPEWHMEPSRMTPLPVR
ncbi:hypothetical protein KI387_032786, partial [Taxus chinensis]